MQFPKLTLHEVAFSVMIAKIVALGGGFPEALVIVAILGLKSYQMWLDKKTSLLKTEEIEKKISSIENKLVGLGLIRKSTSSNV